MLRCGGTRHDFIISIICVIVVRGMGRHIEVAACTAEPRSLNGNQGSTTVSDEGELSVERHPHTLEWGFAIEYSLPYLQSFVQDVGLREPFNRMIPVVEFSMSTALDRGASGTTGTVNPEIIWAGQYVQLAVEAVIPVNSRSGSHVGWIAQLHFFLDDLFPKTIGRPIFQK